MTGPVLVGDIGGTNARFAIAAPREGGGVEAGEVRILQNDGHETFQSVLSEYVSTLPPGLPEAALFAIAGPIEGDRVDFTNRDWRVEAGEVARLFGFDKVRLVNDYAAMARSIPELGEDDFRIIRRGTPSWAAAPILVAGPGTGLGMATLVPKRPEGWQVITGQGGHGAFSPQTAREWALCERLRRDHGYVSNELVLSGSGLEAVHKALCEIDGVAWAPLPPADIMDKAASGDEICHDICTIRAAGLMGALGDAALINGAQGGVVITGGVAERLHDYLIRGEAQQRFLEKGQMKDYMAPIPIRLLESPQAPLIGAAALHFEGEA